MKLNPAAPRRLSPEIHLKAGLSPDELKVGRKLAAWPRRTWRVAVQGLCVVYILSFIAVMTWIGYSSRPFSVSASNRIFFAVILFVPGLLIAGGVRRLRHYRRGMEIANAATTSRAIVLNAIGLQVYDGAANVLLEWTAFSGRRGRDDFLIIFLTGGQPVMLSESRFPDEASWRRFTDFAKQRFPAV